MLYIGANHLGNVLDTPTRVIDLINSVDYVLVEHKIHFVLDMNKLGVKLPKVLVYKEDEEFLDSVVKMLKESKSILLLTQMGYPGIADPGHNIIDIAIKEGIEIDVIPGPSIGPMAIAASGFHSTGNILIETFGQSVDQIRNVIYKLKDLDYPIVVLDRKENLINVIKIAQEYMPGRDVCLCINLARECDQKILKDKYDNMIELIEKSNDTELFGPKDRFPLTTLVFGPKYL
jgi:16S rRNA (cytidine1402-2'-O)-methyltransferase